MKLTKTSTAAIAFFIAVAGSSIASDVTIPNTFSSGSRAVAAEVNANFSAVEDAIDDNFAQVNQLWLADGVAAAPTPNSSYLLTTADAIVRTVTITPPADGMALFTFQSWFTCTSAASCVARCSVNPGGSTLDTSRFAITSVASGQYQMMSITGALDTVEGENLTLNAVCDMFTGVGSLGDPALVVHYSSKNIEAME